MVREHVMDITKELYKKLHCRNEYEEDHVDESEKDDVEQEAIVGEDGKDEALFANDLSGAMHSLSKA